jgi:hypothetical protein
MLHTCTQVVNILSSVDRCNLRLQRSANTAKLTTHYFSQPLTVTRFTRNNQISPNIYFHCSKAEKLSPKHHGQPIERERDE